MTIIFNLTSYPLKQSDYHRLFQSDVICCLLQFGVTSIVRILVWT